VDGLRALSRDYPIRVRPNAPGGELRELFEGAALFWHSMGYGVDAGREPGRMEHFGMVATEAMAAGCVPLLFNGGGLREIVEPGRSGFLWDTLDELAERTAALARDPALRARMAEAARRRADHFSTEAFRARLSDALKPVLA
jgi:glycosyltransferase involved in cell wall biosynthesis